LNFGNDKKKAIQKPVLKGKKRAGKKDVLAVDNSACGEIGGGGGMRPPSGEWVKPEGEVRNCGRVRKKGEFGAFRKGGSSVGRGD